MAPLMLAPPFFHWYDSGSVPDAVTPNVAVLPTTTCWSPGCDVMDGWPDVSETSGLASEPVLVSALFELPEEPQATQT